MYQLKVLFKTNKLYKIKTSYYKNVDIVDLGLLNPKL
jgi:hypothetical protein